ncbi:MAG: hypothetical protein AAFN27_01795 [Pseudomonadota bacterium]
MSPDRLTLSDDVEWDDVQAIVRRPFKLWHQSAHVILTIRDAKKAKAWLQALEPRIRTTWDIYSIEGGTALGPMAHAKLHFNIAFSFDGLRALGLHHEDLARFDDPFREGMAPSTKKGVSRRAGILGDLKCNHSSAWIWGGSDLTESGEPAPTDDRVLQPDIHILLMIFAHDRAEIDKYIAGISVETDGLEVPFQGHDAAREAGHRTKYNTHEHFGFKDGISQPLLPGTKKHRKLSPRWRDFHEVQAGEFVLGYKNERDEYPETPTVPCCRDPDGLLKPARDADGHVTDRRHDLGRNGTYLVARVLRQNVGTFDRTVQQVARLIATTPELDALDRADDGDPNDTSTRLLTRAAGLLMGRALSGEPLAKDVGPADADGNKNDFGFHHMDPAGLHCPIGSHVRRANPRDSLEPDPDTALRLSKQHRILRRSRIYGPREAPGDFQRFNGKGDRGLFFICLNADIAGQFEFIQDSWINNPAFGDLEGERDAILAPAIDTRISFPARPFTRWTERGTRQLVEVRAGGYFFLPGRNALKFIASQPEEHEKKTAEAGAVNVKDADALQPSDSGGCDA